MQKPLNILSCAEPNPVSWIKGKKENITTCPTWPGILGKSGTMTKFRQRFFSPVPAIVLITWCIVAMNQKYCQSIVRISPVFYMMLLLPLQQGNKTLSPFSHVPQKWFRWVHLLICRFSMFQRELMSSCKKVAVASVFAGWAWIKEINNQRQHIIMKSRNNRMDLSTKNIMSN